MQEISPVPSPVEAPLLMPVAENLPQPEIGEKPKIIRIFQKAAKRYEEAYDIKRAEGNLSDEDRMGFVATHTELEASNWGEKPRYYSFKDAEGNRKSIRRNVPLNYILRQLDEDITAATQGGNEALRSELQTDRDYLWENSKPLLRNKNREGLVDHEAKRMATLFARAMSENADSDAYKFMDQAKLALMNERELVVPNPLVRADIADLTIPEKTIQGVLDKVDEKVQPVDTLTLGRTRPGSTARSIRSSGKPYVAAMRESARRDAMQPDLSVAVPEVHVPSPVAQVRESAPPIDYVAAAQRRSDLVRGMLDGLIGGSRNVVPLPSEEQTMDDPMNNPITLEPVLGSPQPVTTLSEQPTSQIPEEVDDSFHIDNLDPIELAGMYPDTVSIEPDITEPGNDLLLREPSTPVTEGESHVTDGENPPVLPTETDLAADEILSFQSEAGRLQPIVSLAGRAVQTEPQEVSAPDTAAYISIHNADKTAPQVEVLQAKPMSLWRKLGAALGLTRAA